MADDDKATNEYLLLSRGQWDTAMSRDDIQAAIDGFYAWYERLVAEGRLKRGHRLANAGKVIGRNGVTDGPFAEAREVIGGYWFIVAKSLDEAAAIAAENPCVACGLVMDVRPLELERASAYRASNETPPQWLSSPSSETGRGTA